MILIFRILRIVDLGGMIVMINIIRTKILIIATTTSTMTGCHRKKSIIFVGRKIVTQIDTQRLNNK